MYRPQEIRNAEIGVTKAVCVSPAAWSANGTRFIYSPCPTLPTCVFIFVKLTLPRSRLHPCLSSHRQLHQDLPRQGWLHLAPCWVSPAFRPCEYLSVTENLSLNAELCGLNSHKKRATFDQLLAFTQLGPFTKRLAGKLSGGWPQQGKTQTVAAHW